MQIPFTVQEFLNVFKSYNENLKHGGKSHNTYKLNIISLKVSGRGQAVRQEAATL